MATPQPFGSFMERRDSPSYDEELEIDVELESSGGFEPRDARRENVDVLEEEDGGATVDFEPSGATRVRQCPNISVSTTDPSGIATGPSGNRSPVVTVSSLGSAMSFTPMSRVPPPSLARHGPSSPHSGRPLPAPRVHP